jgi:AcrR family transcriptional regulator
MRKALPMGGDVDKPGRVGGSGWFRGANELLQPARARRRERRAGRRRFARFLDAALLEFGQHGFHDSSIVGITSRAKVALGTFYTYFDSKEAVFAALVRDMSRQVRDYVAPAIEGSVDEIDRERRALASYLRFVFDHKESTDHRRSGIRRSRWLSHPL